MSHRDGRGRGASEKSVLLVQVESYQSPNQKLGGADGEEKADTPHAEEESAPHTHHCNAHSVAKFIIEHHSKVFGTRRSELGVRKRSHWAQYMAGMSQFLPELKLKAMIFHPAQGDIQADLAACRNL